MAIQSKRRRGGFVSFPIGRTNKLLCDCRVNGTNCKRLLLFAVVAPTKPFVVLTREPRKDEKLASLLKSKGINFVSIPCVKQEKTEEFNDFVQSITNLEDCNYSWMVITSPEAADMLIEAWKLSGKPTLPLLAAVGKSTANRLHNLVEKHDHLFIPTIATGQSLAEQLPILKENAKVYYPTSALASPLLEKILRERGFLVMRWNIYTTVPNEWTQEQQKLAESCSIVAFGSPSAVRVWSERVAYQPVSACIGKTTAEACNKFGFKLIFSAKEPGLEGWTSAIEEAVHYCSKLHHDS
ncbi:hypothetical protein GpartN1_g1994.t1 [Galdieria partita]|uniref:Uroporphyrinogen-III synthase n=1 Tax=Galdieria partita TaxID=83374 RepID=A0A9C7PT11_9RHOD|nr:hypothetical protein GpartN1_g1994.t1 [Galdieria partita]